MLGLESTVSIGKQASAATPATLPRQLLNIYSISGGVTENMPDDPLLGGGFQNGSDPTPPAPGLPDHKLTIEFPVCINQIGFWLAACFGTETVTGAGAPYSHAWKSGQALPYVLIEHKLQTGDYRRHVGCVCDSFAIDWNAESEGFAKVTASFMGLDEVKNAAVLTGTVTNPPALLRPAQALVDITYNGAAGGAIMAGKLTFQRKLKRLRAADGTGIPYAIVQDGKSQATGSIHIRYIDETLNGDAIARTERDMSFSLATDVSNSLTLDLPHMRLALAGIDIKGPDGVEMDFNFSAWQSATDATLAATLLNAAATAAI